MRKHKHKADSVWQLQEAKQRLSELVRRAESEGPQQITKGGVESAWVLSAKDYHKISKPKQGIVEFFQKSPHRDLEIPIQRKKDLPRKIDL